jgi:23S rRNA (adenine2503-C2)-methyltransferase
MIIEKNIPVPTGNILIVKGDRGRLEMLSLGDYGKDINLKCDSLGLNRELNQVTHTKLLSLEEKWVLTISTQYGCSMGCAFCDVPKVGPGRNATYKDLIKQILTGIKLHPEVNFSKRLNIHFARMGEPTWNPNILDCAKWLKKHIDPEYKVHPVVSTMMPSKNEWLKTFIHTWMSLKNRLYNGNAGLQISINSTDENERMKMFNKNACHIVEIAKIMEGIIPIGRKITLNFALAKWEIDPDKLLKYFDPEEYIIKLTPMHKTQEAEKNNIKTKGDYTTYYPYKNIEDNLKKAGYDVLVFIASKAEDLGRITCGNAILSGSKPIIIYQ